VHEEPAVTLTACPGTVRQLIVTGLGRDTPAVIITNDHDMTTRNLIRQDAWRLTIEHHARRPRPRPRPARRPPRPAPRLPRRGPDTIHRRLLETPGQIITTGDLTTVRLERRACSPVLRKASLPPATTIPWWGNRTLRYEFT